MPPVPGKPFAMPVLQCQRRQAEENNSDTEAISLSVIASQKTHKTTFNRCCTFPNVRHSVMSARSLHQWPWDDKMRDLGAVAVILGIRFPEKADLSLIPGECGAQAAKIPSQLSTASKSREMLRLRLGARQFLLWKKGAMSDHFNRPTNRL